MSFFQLKISAKSLAFIDNLLIEEKHFLLSYINYVIFPARQQISCGNHLSKAKSFPKTITYMSTIEWMKDNVRLGTRRTTENSYLCIDLIY